MKEATNIAYRLRRKANHIRGKITHVRGLYSLRTRDHINIKRIDRWNIGDTVCSPLDYFENLDGFSVVDIKSITDSDSLDGKTIILGGGGLVELKWCKAEFERILRARPKRLVCWGAGFNQHGKQEVRIPSYIDQFDLFGVRDYGLPLEWVPCASCSSSLFDQEYDVRHDFVVYLHHEYTDRRPFAGMPLLLNSEPNFKKVLSFLGSGDTVITSSYHGAYWAILLGRKVIIVDAFSQKFNYMRHQPPITDVHSWKNAVENTKANPEALSEARAANSNFHQKVLDLLG